MRKRDELALPNSCLNKARDDEWLFVIIGRDEAAPATIMKWIEERIRLGLNRPGDDQLVDAANVADAIQAELTYRLTFKQAVRLCRDGKTKIRRRSWRNRQAYLVIAQDGVALLGHQPENGNVMLLDYQYGSFWDLSRSDLEAMDWIDEEAIAKV